ncbi:DUF1444 family protein [Planctomicrobium sp. SH661]|uniref:DUF1444 family protein n=1 Tax=Planctomicrobium sp. SH661 TaxID=3448124 RepID=UPI003F5BDAC8
MSESAPDHWLLLAGPANWFRLRHPPRWQADEREGSFALRPPETDALIAINTIWVKDTGSGVFPSLQDIVNQFPRVRHVRSSQETQIEDVSDCMEGEAVLDAGESWWGRIFKGERWRAWKIWAFRRPHLMVVVTLLHAEVRDPELESMTRLMLRCLELPEEPADPPEVFAERALSLARSKFPLLKVELVEEFQLQIETSRLNLTNFYRSYLRDPNRFEQVLLPAMTTAVQVQGWGEQETAPPLEIVRDRLMPMLYPEEVWREKYPDIVGEPWVAGLVIVYVVDESNSYWYVRRDLIANWGLTSGDLNEIAIDNLQSYFERNPMEMAVAASEQGFPSMLMPGKPDTYNTARLLCHSFLSQLREVAEGDLVIGVPGRDFFVAVTTKLPEMVERVRHRVLQDFKQTDHPLTSRMLLMTADGVSELIDDHGH